MTKKKPSTKLKDQPHISVAMVRPFVEGARVQLERYTQAQGWCKRDPLTGVNRCYYEVSSLFEHLATIAVYMRLCGVQLAESQTMVDVRDHIRHDVREEFDVDEKRKKERAERLGLNPKLQMELPFTDDGIKVGATEVKAIQISNFINMADMAVNALLLGGKVEAAPEAAQPPQAVVE